MVEVKLVICVCFDGGPTVAAGSSNLNHSSCTRQFIDGAESIVVLGKFVSSSTEGELHALKVKFDEKCWECSSII